MIINIRGTHGSGKSTLVAGLLASHPHVPLGEGKRPEGYKVTAAGLKRPVYVVGPYTTACGGCDAVQPYDLIWPRVEEYAKKGHVLFEGALVSSSVGNIGRAMAARRQKDCVVCFLDTPVEECLVRIQRRRAARGDERPLNPANTVSKHQSVERSRPKMEALGVRCVTLHYKRAAKELAALLAEAENK